MLDPGTQLGHYEIIDHLGVGGMGEVYRAHDSQLGRAVALKLLLEQVSADEELLARFEREARTLASLNHANVAVIHGFERDAATPFLVMELVEGETLAERIARGPIPVDEAISLFLQIAEGLEAAHGQGVVHRDLKPANVKVTDKGVVKILDFGLAKAIASSHADAEAASQSISPTLTLDATRQGMILGTAAYMAPEQAQGLEADKRADIWAFGACLFEALAGRRAFEAENVPLTLARVLEQEPPWETLPEGLPWRLREVLRRCLRKKRDRRLHDIADARLELLEALDDPAPDRELVSAGADRDSGASAARGSRVWVVSVVAAALAALGAWFLKPAEPVLDTEPQVLRMRLASTFDPEVRLFDGSNSVAISPDGRSVVYSGDSGLILRRVDELESRPLVGGEEGQGPFFSPDGQWVGFFHSESRELHKVSLRGGPSVRISKSGAYTPGAVWSEDDVIYFTTAGTKDVARVSASGGEPEWLELAVPPATVDLRWPATLPGGKALLVTVLERLDASDARIGVIDLESREVRPLPLVGSHPAYLRSGHIVFGLEGVLVVVPFDAERLTLTGDPVPAVKNVATEVDSGAANFAVSRRGSLVYLSGVGQVSMSHRTLHWVDRSGTEALFELPSSGWTHGRISRSGDRILMSSFSDTTDLWLWERSGSTVSRITFDSAIDDSPVWSADEREVFFSSNRDGVRRIYRLEVGASGSPMLLDGLPEHALPHSVTPDNRHLVYQVGRWGEGDLGVMNLVGEPAPRSIAATRFDETGARVSPDGRFLAYQSDESGTREIYVRPFPDVESGRWQVSTGGGVAPLWSPAGDEIFFRRGTMPDDQVMVVPVETTDTFRAGTPAPLFSFPGSSLRVSSHYWDLDHEGQRFLMMRRWQEDSSPAVPQQLVLVQHWFEELDRLGLGMGSD